MFRSVDGVPIEGAGLPESGECLARETVERFDCALEDVCLGANRSKPKTSAKNSYSYLAYRMHESGADSLSDEELLILFIALQNSVENPAELAQNLIRHFESLGRIVSSSTEELAGVPGMTPCLAFQLLFASFLFERSTSRTLSVASVFDNYQSLVQYCRSKMAHRPREQFRILFLDAKNRLILDEVQNEGTTNQIYVYPREVARRAIETNASGIILVHNHPSGDPQPSKADIDMTMKIFNGLLALDIRLLDHLIISRGGDVSFRKIGLLGQDQD